MALTNADSNSEVQPKTEVPAVKGPPKTNTATGSWSSWASSMWTDVANTASEFTKALTEENQETIDAVKESTAVKTISSTVTKIQENEQVGQLVTGVKQLTTDIVNTSTDFIQSSMQSTEKTEKVATSLIDVESEPMPPLSSENAVANSKGDVQENSKAERGVLVDPAKVSAPESSPDTKGDQIDLTADEESDSAGSEGEGKDWSSWS